MPFSPQHPILYLITSGATTRATTPSSEDFRATLRLIEAAVDAKVDLIQLREKNLTDRTLYELSVTASRLTRISGTRLLVNDRADVARAAGADGVHLTTRSLRPAQIRKMFGDEFLIGISTHSIQEVQRARDERADFVVFGPVFETESKQRYGAPVGLQQLTMAAATDDFPVLALGGVRLDNAADCYRAGAHGIAGISLFSNAATLADTTAQLRKLFAETSK